MRSAIITLLISIFIVIGCSPPSDQVKELSNEKRALNEEDEIVQEFKDSVQLTLRKVDSTDMKDQESIGNANLNEGPTKAEEEVSQSSVLSKVKDKKLKKANSRIEQNLKAKIKFTDTDFDFGRIVQGAKIQHEFVFINAGDAPLVINNVQASCGCTMPVYPFIPIEKDSIGKILVQFNSSGRLGRQNPEVKVFSNGSIKPVRLNLTGEVVTEKTLPN